MTSMSSTAGRTNIQKTALAIGAVFLLVGVLGFIPGITTNYEALGFAGHESEALLLGIFQVSVLHNIVHLLFGAAGIAMAGSAAQSRNYLLVGGAKLSGILLERAGDAVVIGFGVNLAHHPQDLGRPATSLAALAGAAPDPAIFLEMLAESLARWLHRWRTEGLGPVRAQWLAAAHPIGTALTTPEGEGLFDGLDETGALRLRLADGSMRVIHAGDVFLI